LADCTPAQLLCVATTSCAHQPLYSPARWKDFYYYLCTAPFWACISFYCARSTSKNEKEFDKKKLVMYYSAGQTS